jgi:hypothetical protein
MNINTQAFALRNVTVKQYLEWCELKKKPAYLASTKKEFFERIDSGKIVKDENGHLIEKRPRKKASK